MEFLKLLSDFYNIQRSIMETDTIYLIGCITVALVLYFYGRKSAFLCLSPLVTITLRYLGIIYEDYTWVRYLTGNFLRFMITCYIVTYAIIYSTKIALLCFAGLALLHVTDKYSQYLDIPYYNWVMLVVVGVTFYNVQKLQNLVCTIIASVYSSVILLNAIEILTKKNLGMKDLEFSGLGLTSFLALGSLFIQSAIHKRKSK